MRATISALLALHFDYYSVPTDYRVFAFEVQPVPLRLDHLPTEGLFDAFRPTRLDRHCVRYSCPGRHHPKPI